MSAVTGPTTSTMAFEAARDLLLRAREDLDGARAAFTWPSFKDFNWALDWFDVVAARPETGARLAIRIVEEDGSERGLTYAELRRRSDQVAVWLRANGVARGDRLLVMLGNQVELWEVLLAAIKLGAVIVPTSTLLGAADLTDRVARGEVTHVVARDELTDRFSGVPDDVTRFVVGADSADRWIDYRASASAGDDFTPIGPTRADDPLLIYFTSGTTAQPKLVTHTHASYPVGHLSTMYWIGLEPGDVHLNVSSPGWAKHAWSNVFAPLNAEATVFVFNYDRFDAGSLLREMERAGVTSFCAPPTVWRMLIQSDITALPEPPKKVVAAGEPLNPEVIEQVRQAWGVDIRDGFGQTETTAQVGNPPGRPIKVGSMGRPLPGYDIVLVDPTSGEQSNEGEICLSLDPRPLGLMVGYAGDAERTESAMRGDVYHTGDIGRVDDEGYITYVGRADDVFKSSDYRISPFEIESVLLEHPAVAEAAVVPSPDPVRLAVPKAYVVLAAGWEPVADTAAAILEHVSTQTAPFKRVRRLEFAELPKTISGKIRRVELRERETRLHADPAAVVEGEFRFEDHRPGSG